MENKLIERIKNLVFNNDYLKVKIRNAVIEKAQNIVELDEFSSHKTNYWVDFRPISNFTVTWNPEKLISYANLKEMRYNNISKMMQSIVENEIYNAQLMFKHINNIISTENITTELTRRTSIGNSCCKVELRNITNYYEYFEKFNPEIKGIFNRVHNLEIIKDEISRKYNTFTYNLIFPPKINKALAQIEVDITPTIEDINKLHSKYISDGDNAGKLHIYNAYNQCIISGDVKDSGSGISVDNRDVINYSLNDYNNLIINIYKNNTVFADVSDRYNPISHH